MNTGYRIVLGLTGAALAASITYGQVGVGQRSQGDTPRMRTNDSGLNDSKLNRHVSKSFTNASAGEVLDWLKSQGISFVAKDADLEGTRLTVNFDNVTLRDAARSIAKALGGYLERQGDVFVFHHGQAPFAISEMQGFSGKDFNLPPMAFGKGNDQNWDQFGKEMEKFGEEFGKKFGDEKQWQNFGNGSDNKAWQDYGNSFNKGEWKNYGERMKEWGEKLKAELKAEGIHDNQNLTPEQERRLQERMKSMPMPPMPAMPPMPPMNGMHPMPPMGEMGQMDPQMMKKMLEHMKSMPGMNPEEMKKMREEMRSMRGKAMSPEDMKKLRIELRSQNGMSDDDMKQLHERLSKIHGMDPEQMKQLHEKLRQLKDMPNNRGEGDGHAFTGPDRAKFLHQYIDGTARINTENLRKLLKSLTPQQRELENSKGYLTPQDLNPEQRELIKGIMTGDHSSVTFVINKDKLNLKNK